MERCPLDLMPLLRDRRTDGSCPRGTSPLPHTPEAPGATVELWNVNARAKYVCEPGAADEDPGFVGFGRAVTASDGSASFRTVWPVSYSRYVLLRRPPHLHLRVRSPGRDDAYEVEVPSWSAAGTGDGTVTLTLAPPPNR